MTTSILYYKFLDFAFREIDISTYDVSTWKIISVLQPVGYPDHGRFHNTGMRIQQRLELRCDSALSNQVGTWSNLISHVLQHFLHLNLAKLALPSSDRESQSNPADPQLQYHQCTATHL